MADTNIYAMTDTWNNAGTTFTGIGMDITATSFASGSRPIDLKINGGSYFYSSTDGAVILNQQTGAVSAHVFTVSYQAALRFAVVAIGADAVLCYGNLQFTNTGDYLNFGGGARTYGNPTTVGALPSAATAGKGSRHFVTDANASTFNTNVAAGGSNNVPVFSDGTNWKIG